MLQHTTKSFLWSFGIQLWIGPTLTRLQTAASWHLPTGNSKSISETTADAFEVTAITNHRIATLTKADRNGSKEKHKSYKKTLEEFIDTSFLLT